MKIANKITIFQYNVAHAIIVMTTLSGFMKASTNIIAANRRGGDKAFLIFVVLVVLTQIFASIFLDRKQKIKNAAILSLILNLIGLLMISYSPYFAVALLAVSVSLFHLLGGMMSLTYAPFKSALVGIYSASGILGFLLGKILGDYNKLNYIFLPGVVLATLLIILTTRVEIPEIEQVKVKNRKRTAFMALLFILVFTSFTYITGFLQYIDMMRSSFISHLYVEKTYIALSVFIIGRAFGGFMIDRVKQKALLIIPMLIAAALYCYFSKIGLVLMSSFILFQSVTPIINSLIYKLFPNKPALSYALPLLSWAFVFLILFIVDKLKYRDPELLFVYIASVASFLVSVLILNKTTIFLLTKNNK